MIHYCIYNKVRSKKGVKYHYCTILKANISDLECCSTNCPHLEKTAYKGFKSTYKGISNINRKPINKVSKNNKLTKATSIPKSVKEAVWIRDNKQCIFCHKPVDVFFANSHYIKRSHLGLGIEENIMTNCQECHELFEQGSKRNEMKEYAKNYFISKYPNWNESMLIYKKYTI